LFEIIFIGIFTPLLGSLVILHKRPVVSATTMLHAWQELNYNPTKVCDGGESGGDTIGGDLERW
jgi:hypothetical protein